MDKNLITFEKDENQNYFYEGEILTFDVSSGVENLIWRKEDFTKFLNTIEEKIKNGYFFGEYMPNFLNYMQNSDHRRDDRNKISHAITKIYIHQNKLFARLEVLSTKDNGILLIEHIIKGYSFTLDLKINRYFLLSINAIRTK